MDGCNIETYLISRNGQESKDLPFNPGTSGRSGGKGPCRVGVVSLPRIQDNQGVRREEEVSGEDGCGVGVTGQKGLVDGEGRCVGRGLQNPVVLVLGRQTQTVGILVVVSADGETPPSLEVPENEVQSRGRPVPEREVVRRHTVPVGVDVLNPPLHSRPGASVQSRGTTSVVEGVVFQGRGSFWSTQRSTQ